MKAATLFAAALGVLSRLVWLAGILYYTKAPVPLILALVLLGTHVLNIAKLRNNSAKIPLPLLIIATALLFVLFALGLVHFTYGHLHGPLFLWGFGSLFLIPLGMNSMYWMIYGRRSVGD
jgi:hypothetical protein